MNDHSAMQPVVIGASSADRLIQNKERDVWGGKARAVVLNPAGACVRARVHACAKSLGHVRLFVTPWTVPARLLCPWDFPGKNTGVGCHFLLHIAGSISICNSDPWFYSIWGLIYAIVRRKDKTELELVYLPFYMVYGFSGFQQTTADKRYLT